LTHFLNIILGINVLNLILYKSSPEIQVSADSVVGKLSIP